MNAVITKRQKNTIMVLGGIAGVFGAVAGTSGLVLREKYLMYDANWDVDLISGFTKGYFGLMSGFIVSRQNSAMPAFYGHKWRLSTQSQSSALRLT